MQVAVSANYNSKWDVISVLIEINIICCGKIEKLEVHFDCEHEEKRSSVSAVF